MRIKPVGMERIARTSEGNFCGQTRLKKNSFRRFLCWQIFSIATQSHFVGELPAQGMSELGNKRNKQPKPSEVKCVAHGRRSGGRESRGEVRRWIGAQAM